MRGIITILLILFHGSVTLAQFSAGAVGLSVKGGTSVVINQLVLRPDTDLTIAETGLVLSATPVTGIPLSSISKVYTINPSISSFKGTVGFYFLDSELNGNLIENLTLVYNPDHEGVGAYVATTPGVVSGNYVSHYFGTAVNLGKITATTESSALPVRLISFGVKKDGEKARIAWSTTSEVNNSHFLIERSADARTFTTLTKVQADGNAGTKKDYSVFDEVPEKSITYYRLKQIDLDGTITDFGIKAFHQGLASDGEMVVAYPNPAEGSFRLHVANEQDQLLTVDLFDFNGKNILSRKIQSNKTDFEVRLPEQLPSGNYVLKIRGHQTDQSMKLVLAR